MDRDHAVTPKHEAVLVGAIVAVAALVRFTTLGHQSYDHDEAVTAWRVLGGGLGHMLSAVVSSERSPPLYYLLAWPSSKVFGTGEVGLRSLSALFGVLTVPAAYLAARELASRRAGLVAASFVAVNPYLVWYSQEARSYSLLVLFVAWGLYFFARCLNDPSPRNYAVWAGASALALCSHYFAVFAVIAEGLWLVVRGRPRRTPIIAFGATLAAGAALVPLAIAQEGTGRRNHFTTMPLLSRAAGTVVSFLASAEPGGFSGSAPVHDFREAATLAGLAFAAIAGVLLLTRGSPRERRGAAAAAWVGAAALVAPFPLAAVGLDVVDQRNLIGALVPLLVAAAIGLGSMRAGRVGLATATAAVALFVAVLAAVYVSGQMQRPDWRGAAVAMGPPASGLRILVVPRNGNEPIAYYRDAREFREQRFGAVRVREIDVLSTLGTITPPRGGVRLVERRGLAPCCTLWRYLAPRPIAVRPTDVNGRNILQERSTALVEGAGGAHASRRSPPVIDDR